MHASQKRKNLSIIILANTVDQKLHDQTMKCIFSIFNSHSLPDVGIKITIIESNPSFPSSYEYAFTNILVIPNPGRFNFNKAVKLGLKEAYNYGLDEYADYVLISNNDVEYTPECLSKLLNVLETADVTSIHDEIHNRPWSGWCYAFQHKIIEHKNCKSPDEFFPDELEFWYQDNYFFDVVRNKGLKFVTDKSAKAIHNHEQSHRTLSTEELQVKTSGAKLVYDTLKQKLKQQKEEPILTVAICGITGRLQAAQDLITELTSQSVGKPVEVLYLVDNKVMTVGKKRDRLIGMAAGKYISFVDDDDTVARNYIRRLLEGIRQKPDVDVVVFDSYVTIDGGERKLCNYDISNPHGETQEQYFRYPNHICCMKKSIAQMIPHKDCSFGEDYWWAEELQKRGLLHTQIKVPNVLYHYAYESKNSATKARPDNIHEAPYAPGGKLHKPEKVSTGKLVAFQGTATQPTAKPKLKIAVYSICKNEHEQVSGYLHSIKDADTILVADTGSTDKTMELLSSRSGSMKQLQVRSIALNPWRFDAARNAALALLPADVDVCIKLDLDERMSPGWYDAIQSVWTPETTRLLYWFDYSPDYSYQAQWIHSRNGYVWKYPCHEMIMPVGITEVLTHAFNGLRTSHHQDISKPRGSYLPMLEQALKEDRCSRNLYYLGREYSYHGKHAQAIETLKGYLDCPTGTWGPERMDSCYMIAEAYRAINNFRETTEWFYRSISEGSDAREPYIGLAYFLHQNGNHGAALGLCLQALQITNKPGHQIQKPSVWGSQTYQLASMCAYDLGWKDKAIEMGLMGLIIDPKNEQLIINATLMTGKDRDAVLELAKQYA